MKQHIQFELTKKRKFFTEILKYRNYSEQMCLVSMSKEFRS